MVFRWPAVAGSACATGGVPGASSDFRRVRLVGPDRARAGFSINLAPGRAAGPVPSPPPFHVERRKRWCGTTVRPWLGPERTLRWNSDPAGPLLRRNALEREDHEVAIIRGVPLRSASPRRARPASASARHLAPAVRLRRAGPRLRGTPPRTPRLRPAPRTIGRRPSRTRLAAFFPARGSGSFADHLELVPSIQARLRRSEKVRPPLRRIERARRTRRGLEREGQPGQSAAGTEVEESAGVQAGERLEKP